MLASSSISERFGFPLEHPRDGVWEIPANARADMRVPARIFASDVLFEHLERDVFEQVTNVASLPGIVGASLCMPDAHPGYGFPIGGVAAFDPESGVISPGGIGFDINCGMRVLRTNLTEADVRPRLRALVDALYDAVPVGVGARGPLRLDDRQMARIMVDGAHWCVEQGFGWAEDLAHTESGGRLPGADPGAVSERALVRGLSQLGTLGSGNHYLEVQVVPEAGIHDSSAASALGFDAPGRVAIMLHCGSRGFGHQVASDALRLFDRAMRTYGIQVRDRELACAPFRSPEGRHYHAGMLAAANMAFANRQLITHRVREVLERVFGRSAGELGLHVVYDVAHNTAKLERHLVDGVERELLVHRKGATRAFGPGHEELPERYRALGQPVIIGGSMETGSAVLLGTAQAMRETYGSTAHGAGRTMSRGQAKRTVQGRALLESLAERGIVVRAASLAGLAEEAGFAYKRLEDVVETLARLDLSRRVVSLRPIGNIKG